jgi:LPS-assembly lipoprotein
MLLFKRSIFGLFALFLLPNCSFKPLYSSYEGDVVEQLSSVKIAQIEGRLGQIMRNALLKGITPLGQPQKPKYILEVSMDFSDRDLGVAKDATTTRSEILLSVQYVLKDAKTGKILHRGREAESSDYNVLTSSYYSNIVSKNNAQEGTVEFIANLVKLSLSSYLNNPAVE